MYLYCCVSFGCFNEVQSSRVEDEGNRNFMSDSKELELQPQKTDFVNNIHSGKYELIFASPETLLQSHREEVLELSKQ